MEPAYSFTIPSFGDDTVLDCRIYHPVKLDEILSHIGDLSASSSLCGALLAHPYAPLGGSYDDAVIQAVAKGLVREGLVVGTFNFRGAATSHGHTTWTGKGEIEDYTSFAGFMVYYLQYLQASYLGTEIDHPQNLPINMVLGGYSYGSLVLSRLPPAELLLAPFESAPIGSSAAEILLRARRLASETHDSHTDSIENSPRGRRPSVDETAAGKLSARSPITFGGEETSSHERRLSRSSHKSVDIVRMGVEVPQRIRAHLHRKSSSSSKHSTPSPTKQSFADTPPSPTMKLKISVRVRYLLISPLLPPLAHMLLPPSVLGFFSRIGDGKDSTGFGALRCPSLALWGGNDGYTSAKRLQIWLDKINEVQPGVLRGHEMTDAGHFWREQGTMRQLQRHITQWLRDTNG